ncbi:MAG: C10 family peptidase [Bacteroidaceae bacterium]|nr:C10 family peptidase [Bacteroidaceae bacterium]
MIILFCFAFCNVYADERSDAEMLSIARQRLSATALTRSGDAREPELIEKTKSLSIYGYPEESFVIVSRNDAYMPVLAISNTPYKGSMMPDGFKWWLRAITQSLEAGYVAKTRAEVTPIDNFVKTTWGQSDPYNGLCPKVGTSRPPTGCVATAMAQIMNYYQYPAQGMGTGSYSAGSKPKTVTIKNVYRWDRMLNSYTPQSGALNKTAVQYLMADAGAAARMEYTLSGSGAESTNAARGFYQNFQYDSLAIKHRYRMFYEDQEWIDMVYNDLSNQRPIMYAGYDANVGGHAFVFSGMDAEGRVYVNWGWDGTADGFYDVNDLAPVTSKSSYNFELGQNMIFGLKPRLAPEGSEDFVSLWVTDEPYYVWSVDKNLVDFAARNFWNLNIVPFEGVLELCFENTANGYTDCLTIYDSAEDEEEGSVDYGYGFASSDGNLMRDTIDISDLPVGSYKVYVRSKDIREMEWRPMRTVGGICYVIISKDAEGNITSTSDDVPDPDGINTIPESFTPALSEGDGVVYDLSGRCISNSLPKRGIYIKKGMKILR